MKSQLIYTFPFPISGFFIVVVVSRDCTQFVANWRTTFLGHSLWVRFKLVLGWSRLLKLRLKLRLWLRLWLGLFGTSLPFDYFELSECVHTSLATSPSTTTLNFIAATLSPPPFYRPSALSFVKVNALWPIFCSFERVVGSMRLGNT